MYSIRHQVLWQHKVFEDCGIDIDDQEDAFHLGAYTGEELVCVASFLDKDMQNFLNNTNTDFVPWLLYQVHKILVQLKHC